MPDVTMPRASRARVAGLAGVLGLEAVLVTVDVATAGSVVFTSAYLIAPLVLALFATPRVVAAAGALSFALAIASGAWDHFLWSGDHVLRCAIVGLAALLALLSARSRGAALEARTQTEAARRGADSARERLDVMLGALAEAVTVHDEHGQTVYANDAAVRLLGAGSVDDLLASKPGDVAARFRMTREDGATLRVDELPGRRAVLGEHAEPTLTRSVNLETGDAYWLLTKATVVHDEAGRPLAVNIIEDVTIATENERRQRFLAEAGRVLASSLDCERTLAQVARLAVPELGDWCAIDLVDELGELRCIAVSHADPAKLELVRRLREDYPPGHESSNGLERVARSGLPELHSRITPEMLRAGAVDDAHLELCLELGLRSVAMAPMRSADRIHGVISLVTSDSLRELHAGELAFVEDLALRAGAAVENARLYRERARTAQTLQDSLLPARLPRLAHFRAASSYRSGSANSTVGGDFYDLFEVGRSVMVLLGDVTGKGVDAAAMTALVRHTAKTAARFDSRPSEVIRVVDEILRERESCSPVTLVCARLVETEREACASVELASGGHPLPLLVGRDGAVRSVGREGLVLGAVDGGSWSDHRFVLDAGETLLFYTDGATDAPGADDRFGEQRLELAAGGAGDPEALVERIDREIEGFQGEREGDDRALLAIQYVPSPVMAAPGPGGVRAGRHARAAMVSRTD
jgi:serine phosphatase RsbU (regulator of sigma subunit)/PAS domain-containing protein